MTERLEEARRLLAWFIGTPYEEAARAYMRAQVEQVKKARKQL